MPPTDDRATLLGLDVGTTNIKAVAFNAGGKVLHVASRPTPVHRLPDGQAVHLADDLWSTVCAVSLESVSRIGTIEGVAVASMAEEGFPLDASGVPLYPGILWHDPRTVPQAQRWLLQTDASRVHAISGLSPRTIYTVHKLAWLRENEPAVWTKMRRWVSIADYIAFRLSGAVRMDLSQASRTCLLDLSQRRWSDELLSLAAVAPDILPELIPSGERIGGVTKVAAEHTGLRPGTPVVSGGHDHLCGALAAGVVNEGTMLHSGGTAEAVVVPLNAVQASSSTLQTALSFGCHVVPDRYYATGGLHSGGVLSWYLGIIGGGGPGGLEQSHVALSNEAYSVPPGARGVLFLPHLYGQGPPVNDPEASGAFLGLRSHHSRADLARAIFEGLAYDARRLTDACCHSLHLSIDGVTVIGGLTRARLWSELKAALLDVRVEVVDTPEAVALGAAMLAGLGVGLFADVHGAISSMQRPVTVVEPNPELVREYKDRYQHWLLLDGAIRDCVGAFAQHRSGRADHA